MGTKAESLSRLRSLLKHSVVSDLFCPNHQQWTEEADAVCQQVRRQFGKRKVIVRSSAVSEDSWNASNAGAFLSLMSIPADDLQATAGAIKRVFASYGEPTSCCQVLIQPMLQDVHTSGVVMTRTHGDNAPYYVINFDDSSGLTTR